MEQEMINSIGYCYAVTYTFAEDFVTVDPDTGFYLDKKILKDLNKRIRNYVTREKMPKEYQGRPVRFQGKSDFKYYAVGEYGELKGRPHYHVIYFNVNVNHEGFASLCQFAWKLQGEKVGRIYVDKLNTKAIRYICGYLVENRKKQNSAFTMISKNIGLCYLSQDKKKYHRKNLNQYAKKLNGTGVRLPRIYRDKIFDVYDKKRLFNKGEKYYNSLSDEKVIEKIQSNRNKAETKKRQLLTNTKFKKL